MALCTALAQEPPPFQILVIGGEGSINNVKQRTAREPIVEVRDRNNRPVAGAVVLFEAPHAGASGTFTGGSPALRVTTNAQGRAVGQGFRPNNVQGNFSVNVSVTVDGVTQTTLINMTNAGAGVNVAHAGHGKLIAIAAVAGAAIAAGTIAALHSGGGGGGTPSATIAAGTGTVGGR